MFLSPLKRFLVGHGSSAFATGAHVVVLAWVAVAVLGLSSSHWAWVQAAALVPNLLLMLIAGAWADRFDSAKVLCLAQVLITFSYLGLFVLLVSDRLGFFSLLVYAIGVGVGNAFVQPAREKLIADIKNDSLQRRVSLFSIIQFSLQSGGMGLAALSEHIGIATVVATQACVSLFSGTVFVSLWKSKGHNENQLHHTFKDIRAALRQVVKNSGLRQLMVLTAFNGYMHMGVFLVLIPLVATRYYQFSSMEYAGLQLFFVGGMITAHVALLHQKTIEYPGQGALFSLLYTALIGFGLAKGPTPFGLYCLVFCWGLVAGNSAGRCRLVLQSLVKPEMRGRAMSVYQLMLFGAAPLGALVTGHIMNYLSTDKIFGFMSMSSIVLFVMFAFTRTLWGVKQQEVAD